jgi:hypothetical protein
MAASTQTKTVQLLITTRTTTGGKVAQDTVIVRPMTAGAGAPVSLKRDGHSWLAEVPTRTRMTVLASGQDHRGPYFGTRADLRIDADGHPWFEGNYPDDYPDVVMRLADGPGSPVRLDMTLPRIRDVTDDAARHGVKTNPPPGTIWNFANSPHALDHEFEPVFSGLGPIDAPKTFVFEPAHLDKPKLIAVAAPRKDNFFSFERFLVYYHHTIGQNYRDGHYHNQAYPYGPDYVELGFNSYLFTPGRGLAFQLAASKRNLALVLPMPDLGGVGAFDQPAVVEEMLLEILGFFQRRNAMQKAPKIAEVAVASYSAGVMHSKRFFAKAHRFHDLVTEVYDFDGDFSSFHRIHDGGKSGKRTFRVYLQSGDKKTFERAAARFQYQLPFDRWVRIPGINPALVGPPPKNAKALELWRKKRGGFVHGMMPALLLHALQLSAFPTV